MDAPVTGWVIAILVFAGLEAVSINLTSIWFALGAVAGLITALFHGPLWLQLLWFTAVSIAALLLTRPLARKYVNGKKVATNADRLLGRMGLVTEDISNVEAKGAVNIDGQFWTARSLNGQPIPAGSRVVARSIQGVKLLVEEATETGTFTKED